MIIQFCGLSGSGKTTLAQNAKLALERQNINVEIIDGDEYRKVLCPDLGYSKEDRNQNIRRLAFVASKLSKYKIVAIICAINPYDHIRQEILRDYPNVKVVFIDCDLETLIKRDTKGLYKRAFLPDDHPGKLTNLTGINDPFETPFNANLIINSSLESVEKSAQKLVDFVLANFN